MKTLQQRLGELATAIAGRIKATQTLLNGNAPDLSGLQTVNKTHIVAAINELKSRIDALSGAPAANALLGPLDSAPLLGPGDGAPLIYTPATETSGGWDDSLHWDDSKFWDDNA